MNENGHDSETGPLRHFRMDRRGVLQSLVMGTGAAMFASRASAAHVHPMAATAAAAATSETAASGFAFLDSHAFETLAALGEQIVPGSRAAQVPEFLDRLLAVETTDTQKRFMQALGAFEFEARAAQGKPWKALTPEQATALLTQISGASAREPARTAFNDLKAAVAETYYSSEAGMKELGWNGGVAFAPPEVCR